MRWQDGCREWIGSFEEAVVIQVGNSYNKTLFNEILNSHGEGMSEMLVNTRMSTRWHNPGSHNRHIHLQFYRKLDSVPTVNGLNKDACESISPKFSSLLSSESGGYVPQWYNGVEGNGNKKIVTAAQPIQSCKTD